MTPTLTQDERLLARIMFVNRLLKANGQAFQALFWAVKQAKHGSAFVKIRPQGQKGDGGNDGFLPADGHYYQVYGPIDPNDKIQTAAAKLADDFAKLKKSWNKTTPIRAYSFAFNDKYEGVFNDIEKALLKIQKSHRGITCTPYSAADLEDEFMSLPPDGMQAVLNAIIPDPARIITVDFSVLKEVIDHIMSSPARSVQTRFDDLPDLAEKIRLNHLSGPWADVIRNGARHAGHIESYFAKNSTFMKQALRDHLVKIYVAVRDGLKKPSKLPSGISIEDLVFDEFRNHLLPKNATRPVEDAVEIIIGFYFEACDVFDPKAMKGDPSASP